jgi:hypothetical protein
MYERRTREKAKEKQRQGRKGGIGMNRREPQNTRRVKEWKRREESGVEISEESKMEQSGSLSRGEMERECSLVFTLKINLIINVQNLY